MVEVVAPVIKTRHKTVNPARHLSFFKSENPAMATKRDAVTKDKITSNSRRRKIFSKISDRATRSPRQTPALLPVIDPSRICVERSVSHFEKEGTFLSAWHQCLKLGFGKRAPQRIFFKSRSNRVSVGAACSKRARKNRSLSCRSTCTTASQS